MNPTEYVGGAGRRVIHRRAPRRGGAPSVFGEWQQFFEEYRASHPRDSFKTAQHAASTLWHRERGTHKVRASSKRHSRLSKRGSGIFSTIGSVANAIGSLTGLGRKRHSKRKSSRKSSRGRGTRIAGSVYRDRLGENSLDGGMEIAGSVYRDRLGENALDGGRRRRKLSRKLRRKSSSRAGSRRKLSSRRQSSRRSSRKMSSRRSARGAMRIAGRKRKSSRKMSSRRSARGAMRIAGRKRHSSRRRAGTTTRTSYGRRLSAVRRVHY